MWSYGPITIKGRYVSMKNGRRVVKYGGHSALIKKQLALDWEQLAVLQVRKAKEPFLGNVVLIGDFYYADIRSDLDENLLKDMLQVKKEGKPCLGIIKNDSQIKRHETNWHLDKVNPRVEFSLREII